MFQVKGGLLEDAKDTLEELERMVTTPKNKILNWNNIFKRIFKIILLPMLYLKILW
jgi:hypothetical protein